MKGGGSPEDVTARFLTLVERDVAEVIMLELPVSEGGGIRESPLLFRILLEASPSGTLPPAEFLLSM